MKRELDLTAKELALSFRSVMPLLLRTNVTRKWTWSYSTADLRVSLLKIRSFTKKGRWPKVKALKEKYRLVREGLKLTADDIHTISSGILGCKFKKITQWKPTDVCVHALL